MFFEEQIFEGFDLSEYIKVDINIPNTKVHVYEFECLESKEGFDEETRARKLDALTARLENDYNNSFQIVHSESSQYFCERIYPLIVKFETKLRYAVYISRALFENGNVNKESFKIGQKTKKEIETTDFGEIYEALFTDAELQGKVAKINGQKLTKTDLIKEIGDLEERTVWEQIVGTDYNYIVEHFLEIKNYRNDVMHNHLVTYEEYIQEQTILQKAIAELERVINDKLLVNNSSYSNTNNVIDVLSGLLLLVGAVAVAANKAANSEIGKNVIKGLEVLGNAVYKNSLLLNSDADRIILSDVEEPENIV